jgi:hypothetical protein
LETQENPGWETFISGKKKYRICLFLSFNGSNCTFLTTRLRRAEIHLKNHSNDSKSRNIELNRVFEKLKQRKGKIVLLLKENL